MRQLTTHIAEGDSINHQLLIKVLDEPGHGGACHVYEVSNGDNNAPDKMIPYLLFEFQNGPIKEVGVNGVTHEALLAILIDRLEKFQEGEYACEDNGATLISLRVALRNLQKRTMRRIARGVEGTHQK